ncbi:Myosin heavy chain kinase B [Fusarium oxysporum f. sp. cubense race 1]|uniref:Myosin heavy chain kinase B n=1 Tax=Fusarium oxysporum f. sp. cubense (strain race 1) TaxID=1229664 RepID=N4TI89_FUSC1|nr:Myosin heavy chain kinase B [Fusarium oxysporum f. sp. cubense race 1]
MDPSRDPSASVKRSVKSNTRSSKDNIARLADDLLRQSLTRKPDIAAQEASTLKAKTPRSSASVTRSSVSKARGSSAADELLRASLVRDASGSGPSVPPSYRTHNNVPSPSSVSRVKDSSTISAAYSKSRLSALKSEVARANAAAPAYSKSDLFKSSCSTDILFLLDTTYSMNSYIETAKNQIRSIVKEIKEVFLNESNVRVAVVGYKDHGDEPNIEFLDFTTSVTEVYNFLASLQASGGGDIPEDVLGGIQKAINASWMQQTRCLIHIADAPPHGHALHDYEESDDDYYRTASEPHGLTHGNLLSRLVKLKVNYALLRINSSTDRMALEFGKSYGGGFSGADVKLHEKNSYNMAIEDSLILAKSRAKRTATSTGPLFEELQLGTGYTAIKHLVVSTVTSSVSRTANRLTLAMRGGSRGGSHMFGRPELTAILEDGSVARSVTSKGVALETSPPRWNTPGWLDKKLATEGFCLDLSVHGADTLDAMLDNDENIKLGLIKLDINARSKPFAEGSLRVAAYARPAATTSKFVLKSFKHPEHRLANLIEDMRMQALCKAFALEFNGLVKSSKPIDFITTLCLQDMSRGSKSDDNLSLEPFIDGEYIKYNSNGAYVLEDDSNPFNEIAQAFSHFTFERSWGHFLVTDLQGVGNSFTDPAIQTKDPERFKLGETNLGEEGFKFFFALHECKKTCRQLGLLTNKEMLMSGKFTFRSKWPAMDPTVCCSNKLCRKIIRLATANKSSDYPEHNWCDGCFPQLKLSEVKVACGGSKHNFQVSRFYHESQGEKTPTVCEEHREKDTTVTSVVGGGLWETTKSTEKKEILGRLW